MRIEGLPAGGNAGSIGTAPSEQNMGLLETGQFVAAGKSTARVLRLRSGRAHNAAGACLRLSRCIARLAMDVRSVALARASRRGVAGAPHAKRSFCGLLRSVRFSDALHVVANAGSERLLSLLRRPVVSGKRFIRER